MDAVLIIDSRGPQQMKDFNDLTLGHCYEINPYMMILLMTGLLYIISYVSNKVQFHVGLSFSHIDFNYIVNSLVNTIVITDFQAQISNIFLFQYFFIN